MHSPRFYALLRDIPAILILITLLGIASVLRIYGIERQGLWADELFLVTLSHVDGFSNIISQLIHDSHPPGYGIFMYFTLPLVGYDDWQIRLHSLVAGVLLVYLTYLIGKRYLGVEHAILGATLVTFSYNAIYYSQEARAYALLACTAMINLYFFMAIFISREVTLKTYAGFILSGILTLYLHYSGFVFVCSEGLLAIIIGMVTRDFCIKKITAAFLPILLLYAPWIPIMYQHMTGITGYWGGNVKVGWDQLVILGEFLAGPSVAFRNTMVGLLVMSSLVAVVNHYRHKKDFITASNHSGYVVLLCMACLPILIFYVKSLTSQTVFQDRHFIYAIPILSLVCMYSVAEVLVAMKNQAAKYIGLVCLCIFIAIKQFELNQGLGLYTNLNKDKIRDSIELIASDKVFMAQDQKPIFLTQSNLYYHYQYQHRLNYTPMYEHYQDAGSYTDAEKILGNKDKIIIYYASIGEPTQFGFYNKLHSLHQLDCLQFFNSGSGQAFIARFTFNQPARPTAKATSCKSMIRDQQNPRP